ncbi:glycosyltransferase family 39 protein [Methyloceanibacter sp.]|uniref:glycosyltransferase family 39 protein n=1 Tax=Methyloceanibacter sp. TaxID=1965321 RepID=UPI003D6CF4BF
MHVSQVLRRGACAGLLIVLAAALRLYGLDRWSLWLDETIQYRESATPLSEFYLVLAAQDMPVSFLLGHAFVWSGLDGNEWQLRLPSAIFGVATVALVFLLARELLGRRAAFFAGLAACVMPVLVIYSQEYRAYSLLVFLTTLSGWSLAAALRTNRPGWWALFVGAAILSLYTHFVAMFFVVGLGLFAIGCLLLKLKDGEPSGPLIWSNALAFAIIGIAFIPALPMLARLVGSEARFQSDIPTAARLDLLKTIVLVYPGFEGVVGYVIAGLAGIGVVWAAFRSPRALLFLLGAFAVPALLYAFCGYARASSSPRYTLPLMAPYAIAVGAGLTAIAFQIEAMAVRMWPGSQRIGTLTTAALAVMIGLFSMRSLLDSYAANPKPSPVDLRGGFHYVSSHIEPNDLLLVASTSKSGPVYWFNSFNSYYLRKGLLSQAPPNPIIDDLNFPTAFPKYLDRQGRLWVLITVADDQIAAVQDRAGTEFDVRCFRQICAIHSRGPQRPMLEQLGAFFDRFAVLDPKYFAASARAVRAQLDQVRAAR